MSRMVAAVTIHALCLVGEQIVANREMLIVLEPFRGLRMALEAIVIRIRLAH